MLEFTFTCCLPAGLHARPAAELADRASVFTSACLLTNLRNAREANLKSPLAIIAANIRAGDVCRVGLTGADEQVALASLRGFIERDLPAADEPLASSTPDDQPEFLPRELRQAGVSCCFGRAVHKGIGHGKVVFVNRLVIPAHLDEQSADLQQEQQRVQRALAGVQSHIRALLALPGSSAQKAVLKAQLAIAGDISLADKLSEKVSRGLSAGRAVAQAGEFFLGIFQQAESAYIRERALDLQDVLELLLHEIYGAEFHAEAVELKSPSLAVAETLSPQQLLSLDRKWLTGLVLESATTTAHAVILARSLGIPTLVGAKDALGRLTSGEDAVLDANRGFIVSCSTPAVSCFYAREENLIERRRHSLTSGIEIPVKTADGCRIEIAANVSGPKELAPAFDQGADGIGLFRTEIFFMEREAAPTEEEQVAIYAQAAKLAGGRPVILRTLDAGADKPIAQLHFPKEDNPFLGYRGVRIYPDFRDLVRTQVRAILRASAFGRIQLMVPMVSFLEEVLWVKSLISQVKGELKSEQTAFNPDMPLGVMIETPSAAFIVGELCAEADFFSLGTNDLSQYFFAADRGNDRVAEIAQTRHPAFLRFLQQIVNQVHQAGKAIGMCGEMAADPANLPLLLGLGLDGLSVSASQIPEIKQKLRRLSASASRELLAKAAACHCMREVDELLRDNRAVLGPQPLLSPELVMVDGEGSSKEAAIREIVETIFLAGRTEDPHFVEEMIWNRESISSTGLGYGFAIPHCKTDAVLSDSIGILKLKRPIHWGSLDEEPVQVVILLAVRESQDNSRHLQILSRLARKLMEEEFRSRFLSLKDPYALVSHLAEELGIE